MADFNPTDDYLPPRKQHLDDVIVTDPQLGEVPFWKALLWNTAHLRSALMRADAVIDKQRQQHDDQPAKPTADPAELSPPVAADDSTKVDKQLIAKIEKAVDALTHRLDALEQGRAAEQALNDLEDCVDAELEQEQPAEGEKQPIKH